MALLTSWASWHRKMSQIKLGHSLTYTRFLKTIPQSDDRLRSAVAECNESNWKDIAAKVGTRNHMQCLQRWMKVLTPGLVKGQWNPKEDAMLIALVNKNYKNWGDLALHMPGRTSKQCRERWCHALDPAIVKGAYTAEEVRTAMLKN